MYVCMVCMVYVCVLLMHVSVVLQECTQRSIARAKAQVLQEIQEAQCKVADAQRKQWEVRVKLERAEVENQK